MHPTTMHCSEREKVRRICTPKSTTGRLEVPEDIFKMWNTAGGREKLFSMWCKSGGVKAIFLETVEILCVTTKSKTLEVKGGFYSEEDMATELKYSRERIEKIKKWATAHGLVRRCEYDETILEYWVNTRTEGSLKREDVERMSVAKMEAIRKNLDDIYEKMTEVQAEGESAGEFSGESGAAERHREAHSKELQPWRFSAAWRVPANDCVEEARAASKCDRCPILQRIASMRMEDADTPLFRKRDDANAANTNEVTMGINLLGNSLGNRFMFCAIHNKYIKEDPSVFYDLLKLWGQELAALLDGGIQVEGRVFRIAILGLTGDAPFLRDAGYMNRSFNNIRKSADSKALLPGVCYLCAAGKTNGPHYEDLDILSADWVSTAGERNMLPWNHPSPLLQFLPTEPRNMANFYKVDLFHVWYAGLGKDYCGSSIVFLLRTVLKKRSKEESMKFLNEELSCFQRIHGGEPTHFGKLSWDLLDYDGPRHFPCGKWSKGMDTGKVCKFLGFLISEYLPDHEHGPHGPMLILMRDATSSIGGFLRTVFGAGFFLSEQEAQKAIADGYKFLLCYMQLAKSALSANMTLYKLKPKAHSMAHLILEMLVQFRLHKGSVCNPVGFSTFMCEDFIGRVARLSRRVSPRVQGRKVIYRYLTALKCALRQES
ncbi:unnamed protein product [Durusdinium trenchii]|uniref:Uncharacterized protein n=1 Tax=Durusdinium trenchii TaxID=1381693 RepID=A0ABP0MHI2_9DINO